MQKKIITTIVVVSVIIIGISCKWFASKQADKMPFNMVGNWQIDTIYQMGDHSSISWTPLAFLDTANVFKSNVDSTLTYYHKKIVL